MADEQTNPLTGHLLSMVQGRQQIEAAKLAVLQAIHERMEAQIVELKGIAEKLEELAARERARDRG